MACLRLLWRVSRIGWESSPPEGSPRSHRRLALRARFHDRRADRAAVGLRHGKISWHLGDRRTAPRLPRRGDLGPDRRLVGRVAGLCTRAGHSQSGRYSGSCALLLLAQFRVARARVVDGVSLRPLQHGDGGRLTRVSVAALFQCATPCAGNTAVIDSGWRLVRAQP